MIVIVQSPEEVPMGAIEVVTKTGPDGVSTCNGRVIGTATRDEYMTQLIDGMGWSAERVNWQHGPHYYKVAVD